MITKIRLLVSTIVIVMQIFYVRSGNDATKHTKKKEQSRTTATQQIIPFPLLMLPSDIQHIIGEYCLYNLCKESGPRLFKQTEQYYKDDDDRDQNIEKSKSFYQKYIIPSSYATDRTPTTMAHVTKQQQRQYATNKNYLMSLFSSSSKQNETETKRYRLHFSVNATEVPHRPVCTILTLEANSIKAGNAQLVGCSDDGMVAAAVIEKKLYLANFNSSTQTWDVQKERNIDRALEHHLEHTAYMVIKNKQNMLWFFTDKGAYEVGDLYKPQEKVSALERFCNLTCVCKKVTKKD